MTNDMTLESSPENVKSVSSWKSTVLAVEAVFARVGKWSAFLAPLLTRLVIGYAFYVTGKGKLGSLDNVTQFFTSLNIPMPRANAVFISSLECFGGIMLMIGLFVRPVSALLGATMIVALMTADNEAFHNALKGVDDKSLTDVAPFLNGMFLIWLMMYGAGAASIDAILRYVLEKAGYAAPRAVCSKS